MGQYLDRIGRTYARAEQLERCEFREEAQELYRKVGRMWDEGPAVLRREGSSAWGRYEWLKDIGKTKEAKKELIRAQEAFSEADLIERMNRH